MHRPLRKLRYRKPASTPSRHVRRFLPALPANKKLLGVTSRGAMRRDPNRLVWPRGPLTCGRCGLRVDQGRSGSRGFGLVPAAFAVPFPARSVKVDEW